MLLYTRKITDGIPMPLKNFKTLQIIAGGNILKKVISLLLSILMIITTVVPLTASAQSYTEKLVSQGFPRDYAEKLNELHNKYPYWIFKPLMTNLDWESAIDGERSKHSNQLISKSATGDTSLFCKCSTCHKNGKYVIQEASDWVSASKSAVEYYMDPRNFLDEKHIFQFESTSYDGTQTKEGVEAILNGTWMHNSLISYRTTGQNVKMYDASTKYSDVIMKAAQDFGLNAYYIAAKIRQENGGATASATAVNGSTSPFQGIYNYFNIGAYTGAKDGLAWAAGFLKTKKATKLYSANPNVDPTGGTVTSISSNQYMTWRANKGDYYYVRLYNETAKGYEEGASGYVLVRDCRTTYMGNTVSGYGRPWTNPYKAIYYGTKYVANSFKSQNTGYLQKFNVSPTSSNKYSNEYMKNVQAAASEAVSSYNGYSKAGILSMTRTFYIPVFKNMSDELIVNVTASTTSSVSLAWNKIDSATGYQVQIGDAYGNWADYAYTGETNLTFSNLQSAYRFPVRIRAYTQKGGNIKWGNFFQLNVATKPGKVSGIKLSSTDTSITVKWKKVSRASGYRIYIYNSSTKSYEFKKSVSKASTVSAKVTGLKPKKSYKIKVAAYKSADNIKFVGTKSGALSIKTKNKSVTLKSAKSSKKKKINVKWKKRSGVSGYQVMWSTTSNFKKNFLSTKVSGSSKTSKTLTTAKSKKNYYVRVRAYKKSGKKYTYYSWSKTIKVKVK